MRRDDPPYWAVYWRYWPSSSAETSTPILWFDLCGPSTDKICEAFKHPSSSSWTKQTNKKNQAAQHEGWGGMTLGDLDDAPLHSLDWNFGSNKQKVVLKCVWSHPFKYCLHPGPPSTHAGIRILLCNMCLTKTNTWTETGQHSKLDNYKITQTAGPPLCSRLKYLDNYYINSYFVHFVLFCE